MFFKNFEGMLVFIMRVPAPSEAARAIIDFGRNELSALKITAAHATWNTPSKKVIEKLGFRFTGENPCGFVKRGNPVPEYEYVIEAKVS